MSLPKLSRSHGTRGCVLHLPPSNGEAQTLEKTFPKKTGSMTDVERVKEGREKSQPYVTTHPKNLSEGMRKRLGVVFRYFAKYEVRKRSYSDLLTQALLFCDANVKEARPLFRVRSFFVRV